MTTEKILRLYEIVGTPEVTEEEATRNRVEAEVAIAAGKRPNRRPKRPRTAVRGMLKIAPSTWWAWVKAGKAPKPIKLGSTVGWRSSDIEMMIEMGAA